MSTRKLKLRKSFILTCAGHFLVYSLILFLLYIGINSYIQTRLSLAFPTLDNLLEYEDALKDEDFAQIPIQTLSACNYIVFSDNGRTVYASDRRIAQNISADDVSIINDFSGGSFYMVYEHTTADGETYYYIHLNRQDVETDMVEIIGSCVLDADYHIVSGDLFPEKTSLSEREFRLIQGVFQKSMNIEKYEYETYDGEARTLVFVSPLVTSATFDKVVSDINLLWLIAIPLIAVVVIIEVILFTGKVRKSILPLNQAIVSYRDSGSFDINDREVPREFQTTVDNFSELLHQLARTQEEKDQIYQEKQQIIADISHDLKTPLTVIHGYAKAFTEHRVPEEKKERYMMTIYNKSELAAELIDSLFEYVHMDHPSFQANRQPMELGEFVKSILAEKYSEIENSGFQVEVDIAPEPIPFSADPKLLRRLLENLLGNALKYNPPGTTIYVSLQLEKSDSLSSPSRMIHLTVADDGVGIPEDLAFRIFDPFVTGSTARTSGKGGTGLGLSIARRIVELHDGKIHLALPPRRPFSTEFIICFSQDPFPRDVP